MKIIQTIALINIHYLYIIVSYGSNTVQVLPFSRLLRQAGNTVGIFYNPQPQGGPTMEGQLLGFVAPTTRQSWDEYQRYHVRIL